MTFDNTRKDENLKILSLEDSARDFELIKELLIDAGYCSSITWVETEDAFTTSLRDQTWDVILADFKLPGFDAFGAVRIRNEICPDTPFICVSGSIGEETAIELLKAGAVDYVLKDRPDRLPFAVERALNEARQKKIRQQNTEALQEADRQLRASQSAMLNILEDLKAENQTRQTRETELQKITVALEQAGEMVFITDLDGTIQYVNPAVTTVSGYSREEVVGQNPSLLKSGQQDQAFYQELWETIASGRTWSGRLVNKRKDGTLYTEMATISPVKDDSGRILSYVAVKRDITEHLNIEMQLRQAQKMESIGRLAGGVAHDFNNMLTVILGHAKLGLMHLDPANPVCVDLKEISKTAERSADLTRQLLTFARKQTIAPKTIDLNDTVSGMLKMLQRLIGEDINLSWHPAAELWQVRMDPSQTDQILANLCVNARDAIAENGRITIETANRRIDAEHCIVNPEAVPGEYVCLTVSDSGSGMDKETQAHIFEPFYTTKELGKGTGLGLATVYGAVKQNNGFISIYSETGQGTTFSIYLPRETNVGTVRSAPTDAETAAPRGKETILLVEDEPAILNITRMLLQNQGYTVLAASSPDEAIRLASEQADEIQLLMTDVVMPEMNGRDLAQKLQSLYPQLKCLYMSGYTADVIAPHGVLGPGVYFIQKPYSMNTLAIKLREVLDGGS